MCNFHTQRRQKDSNVIISRVYIVVYDTKANSLAYRPDMSITLLHEDEEQVLDSGDA
jgi:hypothetical protein